MSDFITYHFVPNLLFAIALIFLTGCDECEVGSIECRNNSIYICVNYHGAFWTQNTNCDDFGAFCMEDVSDFYLYEDLPHESEGVVCVAEEFRCAEGWIAGCRGDDIFTCSYDNTFGVLFSSPDSKKVCQESTLLKLPMYVMQSGLCEHDDRVCINSNDYYRCVDDVWTTMGRCGPSEKCVQISEFAIECQIVDGTTEGTN